MRRKVRARISGPVTAGYEPLPYNWLTRHRDLPLFTFQTVRGMLLDPGIKLNLATRAAPLMGAKFGFRGSDGKWQEGLKCDDQKVGQWLYAQLQRIWRLYLPYILRAQVWGWSGGEVTLKYDETLGMIGINKMEPRFAGDVRLLKLKHERWGVEINRVKDIGKVNLPFPYCWFHCYNAEDGEDYGTSCMYGAYSPWADKWFPGGAVDVRRLFMHKDAYGGVDLGYPEGTTWVEGQSEPIPNRDIARQIVEQLQSGGVTTRPSDRDENGNEKWPLTRASITANPTHILQYPHDLDREIRQGMEIADDVGDTEQGSWAGKRVSQASFYATLDAWMIQIICDLSEQLFEPLIMLNCGRAVDFQIQHMPLAEQAMEQQSNAGPQGQQQNQQQPFGQDEEQWEPYRGQNGGNGWRNLQSGSVVYGDQRPGDQQLLMSLRSPEGKKPGCVMLEIPKQVSERILELQQTIPASQLHEEGKETWPHVTLLYGIDGCGTDEILQKVSRIGQLEIEIGKADFFENETQKVLKLPVDSPELHSAHEYLKASLPNEQTYPDYKPHITLAYLKPESTVDPEFFNTLAGLRFTLTSSIVAHEGDKTRVALAPSTMSLDPIDAVGSGLLSASRVVEAARLLLQVEAD